jgi:hypothetical protein
VTKGPKVRRKIRLLLAVFEGSRLAIDPPDERRHPTDPEGAISLSEVVTPIFGTSVTENFSGFVDEGLDREPESPAPRFRPTPV